MTNLPQRFSFDPVEKKIIVHTGKVEIGQHVHSAFQQIVAHTLKFNIAHIRVSKVTTSVSPDDGLTVGSLSVQFTGEALRSAALDLRSALFQQASSRLNAAADDIILDADTLEACAHGSCI